MGAGRLDFLGTMSHGAGMARTRKASIHAGQHAEGHVRQRLLKSAARLLSEAGLEGATARAICADVGVTAPTLYHYFGDLGRLHAAAVNAAFLTVAAEYRREARSGGALNGVRQAWSIFMTFARSEPRMARLLISRVLDGGNLPAVRLTLRQLQGDLDKLDAAGQLAVPPRRAVRMLWTASVGAAAFATIDEEEATADLLLDAVLAAIAPSVR